MKPRIYDKVYIGLLSNWNINILLKPKNVNNMI